jgi:Zn-dependent alcohol dehydrogenase
VSCIRTIGKTADRVLRGINVGSKHDLEDLYAAVAATRMRFDDIVDARFGFKKADEAIEHVWQGKQVSKVVVDLD